MFHIAQGRVRRAVVTAVARSTVRPFAQVASKVLDATTVTEKEEGSITDIFRTTANAPLPPRFADLKKEMCLNKDALVQSWREVLEELEVVTEKIARRGSEMVMRVSFEEIQRGLSEDQLNTLKETGVVIVKGGVPKEVATSWMQSLREYVRAHKEKVVGAPPEKIVFYEIYNSKAQIAARTHPALIETQRYLLSLWHASDPRSAFSARTPISYFDRFRIRPPGPSGLTLGPHIDGGSIERWEDPGFRSVWRRILEGGSGWRQHDPFDVSPRLNAVTDLYNASNQCSVFRPWQGWTALSSTGPGEGTLRVLPMLSLATAYIILRPFFRLRHELPANEGRPSDIPLNADAWVLDLDDPDFPGSRPRKVQNVTPETHPHLRLDRTVVSIPRVEPGDQVYWHTDLVHAVEAEHNGTEDSCVLYIPATPLTERNAAYLRTQRETFMRGLPPPDYPQGQGEASFVGRATPEDITCSNGRRILGLEPFSYSSFVSEGERKVIEAANKILAV